MSAPEPPPADDPGVLSGLSRTRPQRRSGKRPGRAPADGGGQADPPKTTAPMSSRRPQAAVQTAAPATAHDEPTQEPAATTGGGLELVAQAIQAAGEVAQLGLGIGQKLAKSALSRLPRP